MLYVEGTCPVCDAGVVAFRRCDDGRTIVLMCDECDALWLHPDRRTPEDAVFPGSVRFEVPGTTCALVPGPGGWATRADVERVGWESYIVGETGH